MNGSKNTTILSVLSVNPFLSILHFHLRGVGWGWGGGGGEGVGGGGRMRRSGGGGGNDGGCLVRSVVTLPLELLLDILCFT